VRSPRILTSALALLAVVLAGCGGSSSDERTLLLHKLSAQLSHNSFYTPELTACVTQKARALPTAQLRNVVNAGATAPPGTIRVALRMVVSCVSEGHGTSALRAQISAAAGSGLGGDLPPEYLQCLAKGLGSVPNAQLAGLVNEFAADPTKGHADAQQLGVKYGLACLGQPAVLHAMLPKLIAPIKAGFQARHYSAAFTNCVIAKAERIAGPQVQQLALAQLRGQTAGAEALGRAWARACIASGARP
jgi:hypothetical protein